MIRALFISLIFVYSGTGLSLETSKVIDVGGKEITLKSPSEFHMSEDLHVLEYWKTVLGNFSLRALAVPNVDNDKDSKFIMLLTQSSTDKLNFTKDLFVASTKILVQNQATLMESLKGYIKELNDQATKRLNEKYGVNHRFNLVDSTKLNVFINNDRAVSFYNIQESQFSIGSYKNDEYVVGSITYLRLKDKLVVLYIYSDYKDIQDIVWLRNKTIETVDMLLKINSPINSAIPTQNSSAEEKYKYARLLLNDFRLREAQQWMEKAALDGHVLAQSLVGSMYITGDLLKLTPEYTAQDVDRIDSSNFGQGIESANTWLRKAKTIKGGYKFSLDKGIHYLDMSYKNGNKQVKAVCSTALEMLAYLAKKDNKYNYKLGKMYFDGTCTDKDYGKAYRYIKQSAQDGNSIYAQQVLGEMYLKGNGVKKDFEKSVEWFKKSAEGGNPRAYLFLAVSYQSLFEKYKENEYWDASALYIKNAIEGYSKDLPNNKRYFDYAKKVLEELEQVSPYEDRWVIEGDRIYTNGSAVHGHKFGYFKDKEHCGNDSIFIMWSTYEKGLEAFEGIEATIALSLNGKGVGTIVIPSTLVATANLTVLSTLAIFKTSIFPKELSKDIRESASIELTFVGPDDLVSKLDIKSDSFNTSGLAAAYSKFDNSCK